MGDGDDRKNSADHCAKSRLLTVLEMTHAPSHPRAVGSAEPNTVNSQPNRGVDLKGPSLADPGKTARRARGGGSRRPQAWPWLRPGPASVSGLLHPGLSLSSPPVPSWVPSLTGLADPLDVATACLDDAVKVPGLGPRGPGVPIHVQRTVGHDREQTPGRASRRSYRKLPLAGPDS